MHRMYPETTTEHTVPIADIVLRNDWQVRNKVQMQTVKQYAAAMRGGVEMPPIRLANVNGALMLVDGWHRLAAARSIDQDDIQATVEVMTEKEAALAAALANTTHGLTLKRNERFRVFQRYMADQHYLEKPNGQRVKSLADIVKNLNGLYSRSGVHKLIKDNYPKVAARISKGSGEKRRSPADLPKAHISAFQRLAGHHFQQILAAARGLSEGERAEAATVLEQMAHAVRTASPWEPPKYEAYEL